MPSFCMKPFLLDLTDESSLDNRDLKLLSRL
jgi:hypothetical protein